MDKIFKCSCGCGGVEISTWDEDDGTYIYIEFLKRCRGGRRFKQRFRMAWKLIRFGYYYDDDIILTLETARELGEELLKLSKEK